MKRVVIFNLSYKGDNNVGNRTERKTYSIFKRKSSIVNDFFNWTKEELLAANILTNNDCIITNIQVIGL